MRQAAVLVRRANPLIRDTMLDQRAFAELGVLPVAHLLVGHSGEEVQVSRRVIAQTKSVAHRVTRSGSRAATASAHGPPAEIPMTANSSIPSRSAISATSSAASTTRRPDDESTAHSQAGRRSSPAPAGVRRHRRYAAGTGCPAYRAARTEAARPEHPTRRTR